VQVVVRFDLAAPRFPIVWRCWVRDAEVQVRIGEACIAAFAGQAKRLAGDHTHTRRDSIGYLRQVRAIVAHAIVANDRHS